MKNILLPFMFFMILMIPGPVLCSDPIFVEDDLTVVQIGKDTDVFRDPSQNLSLAEILLRRYQAEFKPHRKTGFNFGMTPDVIWLRFKIRMPGNNSPIKRLVLAIDKPAFPSVNLYVPTGLASYNKISEGYANPTKGLTWEYRYPVFKLPQGLPENRYLYLQVTPASQKRLAAASFTLFLADEGQFRKRTWFELSFYFLIFGVLASMIFYNLSLFIILKDRVYSFYVVYITFLLIYLILRNGFANLIGWHFLTQSLLYTVAIAYLFSILFSQNFLNLKLHTPVLNRILWGLSFFTIMVIPLLLFGYGKRANQCMHLLAVIGPVTVFTAGIIRYRQGYQPARYYILAWFMVLVGTTSFGLIGLGVLPKNFMTLNALSIGSTLEAVLLSTALGDRIRTLRREKRLLLKKERLLTDIIEFLPDPTWVIDTEGKVIAWNHAMEQITGIHKNEIMGNGNHEYAVPFYGKPRPMLIDLALKRNENLEKEYLTLKDIDGVLTDGESYHPAMGDSGLFLSGTACKLNDSKGRVIGAIETIRDITATKRTEQERERMITELQDALKKVRTLSGLLPICASCKKIRDDKGYWNQIESYIHKHSDAEFSHGMCPECLDKMYGNQDWYKKTEYPNLR